MPTVRRAFFLLVGTTASLAAQDTPAPIRLTKPDAISAEGFSTVNGLAELKGGKVVAVDGRDRVIRLIDFAHGSVSQIGRTGNGPGEYQGPGGAVTLTGDTVWVTAIGNKRLLAITPEGRIVASLEVPLSAIFSGHSGFGFSAMQGLDPAGRFYWESFNFDPAQRMGQVSLTADIYRWRQGMNTADVVRRIVFRDKDFPIAFNRRDGWGVAADGRVAFVYGAHYHVEWIGLDGSVTKGPATSYDPVPVTQHEREEWTRQRAALGGAGRAQVTGPSNSTSSGPPPAPRPPPEVVKFPQDKPPFPDRSSIWVSREGDVWVATSRPVDATTNLVDVFDRTGRRVR